MNSLRSFFPPTLSRERELAEIKCNLIIDAFNQLADFESERLRAERALRISRRVFTYSVKEINDGWRILYKEVSPNSQEEKLDDDVQWSIPFKILNKILFHRHDAHEGKCWVNANKIIPQGFFDESILNEINKDW